MKDYPLVHLKDADLSDPERVMILDVETTGLNPDVGNVLQCAIIDATGTVLHSKFYDSYLLSWPEAEAVNRISKCMVEGMPMLCQESDEVTAILSRAKVIMGYNVCFDLDFLRSEGVRLPADAQIVDVMREYSYWAGIKVLKRFSLTAASKHLGIININEHDALGDAVATLDVAKVLMGARE